MTQIQWRSLFQGKKVEGSTYAEDVVGPLVRFDERDHVLARMDLKRGTDRYEEYYRAHEEFQAADDFLRAMPPPGSTAAAVDSAVLDALFESVTMLGRGTAPDRNAAASNTSRAANPDPQAAAEKVKSVALHLGADLAGTGRLNPGFVYSHTGRTYYGQRWGEEIALSHPNVISIGIAMDYGRLRRYAPGFPTMLESALVYAKAAAVAVQLALFIRGMGFSARAHHLRDYQLLCVPVAVDCGLGELGRSGVLLTREFGSALRLAAVSTDLPLAADGPVDLGIQQFCGTCRLCAMACPSGAVPCGGKMVVRGVRRWKLAAGRCYHYWREAGSDCALCLVACPWSQPDEETACLRPTRPPLVLEPESLAAVAAIRATLPAWLRRYLGDS